MKRWPEKIEAFSDEQLSDLLSIFSRDGGRRVEYFTHDQTEPAEVFEMAYQCSPVDQVIDAVRRHEVSARTAFDEASRRLRESGERVSVCEDAVRRLASVARYAARADCQLLVADEIHAVRKQVEGEWER